MCGIVGYVSLDSRLVVEGSALGPMLSALCHRGPDAEGRFCNGRVALGHRRLTVLDPEGGRQPVLGARKSTVLVTNGEIYNHEALAGELAGLGHRLRTRSDSEVLAHTYDAWGLAFLERLDGMFALALWDDERRRLVLARDRMGEKPLFYACSAGLLLFASELTALMAHPAFSVRVDPEALSAYLLLEYVPAPRSLVQGAFKLAPGEVLVLESGNVRTRRYWQLRVDPEQRPFAQRAAELRTLLERSVRSRLVADVPLGVFVSGGIDSAAIAAMAARTGPIPAFCVGFEDAEFDERKFARAVAVHLGLTLHERVVTGRDALEVAERLPRILDEPIGDASVIPTTVLCAFAREQVKVALCGEGSDELFAGYPMHRAERVAAWLRRMPECVDRTVRRAAGLVPFRHGDFDLAFKAQAFFRGSRQPPPLNHVLWMSSFSPAEQESLLEPEIFAASGRGRAGIRAALDAWESLGPAAGIARSARFDALTFLPGNVLAKTDRSSMSVGLELRSPFLAADLVAFALRLSDRDLMRGLSGKRILREALRGTLPPAVLHRAKKGFGAPMARWLNGPLRELADDLLSAEALRKDGWFRPAFVQRLLAEHRSGRRDHRKPLWTLLAFRLWQEGLTARSGVPPGELNRGVDSTIVSAVRSHSAER